MFMNKSGNERKNAFAARTNPLRPLMLFFSFTLLGAFFFLDTPCPAEPPQQKPIQLQRIRSIRGKGYTAFIFKFDKTIPLPRADILDTEISVRFDGVVTRLDSHREYRKLQSWIGLEPEPEYLRARIGLPHHFSRMDAYRNKNRHKWIIRLYTEGGKTSVPVPAVAKTERQPSQAARARAPAAPSAADRPLYGQQPEKRTVDTRKTPRAAAKSNGLLTLNFYQSEIQEILSALAMEREINIAAAQDVTGQVSVHLYQVTLKEALDAIALAGGFKYRVRNGLYYFYKPKQHRDPQSDEQQLKIFKLRYAETGKVQEILKSLPNMGYVQAHKPSKTLIVQDTDANLKKIEDIIGYWDRPPKQVLIEAKILQVRLTDGMEFGVDWSKILGELNIGTKGFSKATLPGTEALDPRPGDGAGVFTNLITAIGTNHQFAVALDALQTKTKINTLSTPKVLAIHGKAAKVQVGGQQGYRVTTTNLGVATESIQFIDTGTILEITPYIGDDGHILLNVMPSIASAELDKTGIPVVRSTQVTTWLMAKSGETVFIGGLIEDASSKKKEGLPCLGNLEAIGTLFSRTTSGFNKIELVVLITPQLIGEETEVVEKETKDKVHRVGETMNRYPLSSEEEIREFIKPIR